MCDVTNPSQQVRISEDDEDDGDDERRERQRALLAQLEEDCAEQEALG
jgi:hypothetical protein